LKRLKEVYDSMLTLESFLDAFYKVKKGRRDKTKILKYGTFFPYLMPTELNDGKNYEIIYIGLLDDEMRKRA
jgi:benzoyl-CoA reductase/2-hydroxyglutaryl-CoA dehydratase subunit BcrC/BadD/HgdB